MIEIFDSLQGEGYWTGVPMTFVRLAGCNAPELGLDCVRWCDTPGSWAREPGAELEPEEILDRARLPRLCLTGGEPLLQTEGVVALVATAHRARHQGPPGDERHRRAARCAGERACSTGWS